MNNVYKEEKNNFEMIMRDFLIKNNTHSLGNEEVSFGLIEQKPIICSYFGEDIETTIDMIYIDSEGDIMVENHFISDGNLVNDTSIFIEFSNVEMKNIMQLCGIKI